MGRLGTEQTCRCSPEDSQNPQKAFERARIGKGLHEITALSSRARRMAPVSHFGKRFRRLCLQTHKVNFSFGLIEGRFSRHVKYRDQRDSHRQGELRTRCPGPGTRWPLAQ